MTDDEVTTLEPKKPLGIAVAGEGVVGSTVTTNKQLIKLTSSLIKLTSS